MEGDLLKATQLVVWPSKPALGSPDASPSGCLQSCASGLHWTPGMPRLEVWALVAEPGGMHITIPPAGWPPLGPANLGDFLLLTVRLSSCSSSLLEGMLQHTWAVAFN